MPQEAEYGKRYAQDMRRIRAARNLSVGDVHDETKIPLGLIEAFEDKALFDHPQFNRVYLRSFVRTYAQVVGIDADVALEGLEEALSGRYTGSLAVAYLGDEPEQRAEERADESEPEGATGSVDEPVDEVTKPADEPEEEDDEDISEDEDEQRTSFVSTTQATAAGYRESREAADEEEDGPEDWSAQSPPSARAAASSSRMDRSRRRPSSSSGPDRRWVLGIGLVVVVGGLIWILVSVLGGSETGPSSSTVPADTSQAVAETDTSTTPAPAVNVPALGDSMDVRIVASQGKVDPIRVTVDNDLRRPYWIERGDSLTFRPTDRIVIEELLDSVTVKIEGVTYPTNRRDAQGRLVISRDTAQTYFTSLRSGR